MSAQADGVRSPAPAPPGPGPLPVLLLAVLGAYTAQQMLFPVLPPLARSLGLTEVHLGLVMTVASATFATSSLVWGTVVDAFGTRRTLILGLLLATTGLTAFSLVAALELAAAGGSPGRALALVMLTRGLLFGLGLGAVPVAALAFVSRSTVGESARTQGVGRLGAAQGVALALGPALGGLLGFAGLLGPVWAAPLLPLSALVAVLVLLPRDRTRPVDTAGAGGVAVGPVAVGGAAVGPVAADGAAWVDTTGTAGPAAAPAPGTAGPAAADTTRTAGAAAGVAAARAGRVRLRPWDRRFWPFLAAGFLVFLSLGMILIVLGFLFQDRLGLDPATTVRAAGASSFATGVVLVLGQAVLVRRLGWSPRRLLCTGVPISVAGCLGFAAAGGFWTMVLANMVIGLGMSLALPGYTAGPTLRVEAHEQGAVAGLINATTGATFVVGPLLGTSLYQVGPTVPLLASAGCGVLALLFVVSHPGLGSPAHAR